MKRILVVEDEKEVRENIIDILESEKYDVCSYSNAEDTLEEIDKICPDLIISDILLPGIDGYKLLESIIQSKNTDIPFIFISALSEREDIRFAMGLGADDYISKPFTADEILVAVRTQISKKLRLHLRFEKLKSKIIKFVPHELRTPLFPILGYADIILENKDLSIKEIREFIKIIKQSGVRLSKRIEKFLLYSELFLLDNELEIKKTIKNKCCSIGTNELSKLISTEVKINGRSNDLRLDLEYANVKIPEKYFVHIIIELLENACKFSETGEAINIFGGKMNGTYRLEVEDFGRGMSEVEIIKIQAFNQYQKEEYQQIGNGLGLALVKRITELIGGVFNITSLKGRSTKVIIDFSL